MSQQLAGSRITYHASLVTRHETKVKRIVLLLFCCLSFGLAEFDKVGTTAAQFLRIGVGARARGMGGSFVALADDGSAHYWNPAGMTSFTGLGATFSHNVWALDITHEFVSLTIPANTIGVFGFSLSALTMDEKEITTVREPEGTGLNYSVMDMALGASYAKRISDRLSYGITFKYIRLAAHHELAQTFAVDMGSILRTNFYGMRIGMALSNFGGEVRYEGRDLIQKSDIDDNIGGNYLTDANLRTEPWPLPLIVRIGLGFDVFGQNEAMFSSHSNRLTFAIDAEHPNDSPEHVNIGTELALWEMIFLRGGYRFNYDEESLTFGFGLSLPIGSLGETVIDYAVMPLGPFGNTSIISIEFHSR